jgi:hypothetical protein
VSAGREDRFPYPLHLVVGVFDSEQGMRNVLAQLRQQGFESEAREVLHGEGDAHSLDPEGELHGAGGELIRALQAARSYEREHVREHAKRLRAGDYIVGVYVGADEEAKRGAADAMRSSGGDFVHYYAVPYIESL